MKYNNKSFQERYEAWKNGADYWKDIRGVNLGVKAQEDEPSEEERQQLKTKINSILDAYTDGKDDFYSLAADYIIKHEGFEPVGRATGDGKITIGYGTTDPRYAKVGTRISRAAARKLLMDDLRSRDARLFKTVGRYADLPDSARMALLSYDYNYPTSSKKTPKLYAALANGNWKEAARQMDAGMNMKGFSGLKKRRADEQAMFLSDLSEKSDFVKQLEANQDALDQQMALKVNTPTPVTLPTPAARVLTKDTDSQVYNSIMANARNQMLEPVPMPNAIQKMLQSNNRGKDGYGQKFWQRRGVNLHFKGGKDKQSYQDWADKAEKYKGININGDNTYDYRAFYNENPNRAYALLNGDPGAHFVDKFKTPYHPTFSDESVYSNASHPGGHWGRYDYRDAYYAPMFSYTNPGDRIGYLNMAEDNGVIPFMNNGSMYRVDGDLYGGVLPAVTVTPKQKFDIGTDNNAGGDLVKLLGGGEGLQEVGNFAAQMIPGYGSYLDWKQAINDPSLENIGTAALTTAGDLFTVGMGGAAIRASIKAAKAVKELRKAREAYKTTKALVPGTKQVVRAIEVVGKAADKTRAAQQREKAIKAAKNSVKAEAATHLTDMKDGYQRAKRYIQKHYL